MKKLNETESKIFVLLCVLCFQRQPFRFLLIPQNISGALLIWGSYLSNDGKIETRISTTTKENSLKQHLTQACLLLNQKNLSALQERHHSKRPDMFVSENFKLIACRLFKVGSTNIGRVIYALDHLTDYSNIGEIDKRKARKGALLNTRTMAVDLESNKMKTYTKFMFVRDPLERLLSAYRARNPHGIFKKWKRLSFRKFLNLILDKPDEKSNLHFVSFSRMCHPCVINYDFIGLLDNYERDMRQILRSVGAENAVILPKRNQTGYTHKKTGEVLKRYLKDVPKATIQKIYERYYLDYYIFGFKKPEF